MGTCLGSHTLWRVMMKRSVLSRNAVQLPKRLTQCECLLRVEPFLAPGSSARAPTPGGCTCCWDSRSYWLSASASAQACSQLTLISCKIGSECNLNIIGAKSLFGLLVTHVDAMMRCCQHQFTSCPAPEARTDFVH